MEILQLLFFLLAIVLFLVEAFWVNTARPNLIALGLAALSIALLLEFAAL